MYLRWRRRAPSWIRIHPLELPGRGGRLHEAPAADFDGLVARLCDEVEMYPAQRYVLFGHSMGALLAYRVAHCLRSRKCLQPDALVVSACAAPSRQDWRRYTDRDSLDTLIADLRRQNGTPEAVLENPQLLSMTLSLLHTDYRTCASFRYAKMPPLGVPLHVLCGRGDGIHASRLEAWRSECTGEFSLDWFEGGHFFFRQHEEAFLKVLVQRLAADASPPTGVRDKSHAALTSA